MLEIADDAEQWAFAKTLTAFCAKHDEPWTDPNGAAELSAPMWTELAEIGALGLTAPDSGAEPLDVAVAHEALGAGGCAGPLWATALVVTALTGEELDAVVSGRSVVTAGALECMPWAASADLVFDTAALMESEPRLVRCKSVVSRREFSLLGFEPAAEIGCVAGQVLAITPSGRGLAELALASYLVGGARRVLDEVAHYVGTRRQFRQPLSQFQAVTHPLADCDARIAAARVLVRRTASRFAAGPVDECAVALGSAARAARLMVYQAHQSYGAIGFTEEGPLAWIGARLGQLSTHAEALWRGHPIQPLLPSR